MSKLTKHTIKGREFTFEQPVTRAYAIKFHGFNKVKRLKPKVHFSCNIIHKGALPPTPMQVKLQETLTDNLTHTLIVRARH
jgi:hypothetical protein